MRLIFAGLLVFGGMIGLFILFEALFPNGPALLVGPLVALGVVLLCVVAVVVLNAPGVRPFAERDPEEEVRKLEEAGLLSTTRFLAERAFAVEEFEDEGSHYFLELDGGSVLSASTSTITSL